MSLFENTGISLLWRIIGSYLAGIYNAHLGGTFADDYEDYCLSERGCVYAFITAKVFKCFFIANFSKSWGFFEIEIPVNFRTQLIQAPSNFKYNNHYSTEILSIIARFACLFS